MDKDTQVFMKENVKVYEKLPFEEIYADIEDKRVFNLIERMLAFNPQDRFSAEEAI
jgi:serine/threonine protein kinase